MTRETFRNLQQKDSTLGVTQTVTDKLQGDRVLFLKRERLLFGKENEETEKLVVPKRCRKEISKIAHDMSFAGYLGREDY